MKTQENQNKANKYLYQLRVKKNFFSAAEFARKHNISESTYRSHENGTRRITYKYASKYSKIFKVKIENFLNPNIKLTLINQIGTYSLKNIKEEQIDELYLYVVKENFKELDLQKDDLLLFDREKLQIEANEIYITKSENKSIIFKVIKKLSNNTADILTKKGLLKGIKNIEEIIYGKLLLKINYSNKFN